VAFFCVRRQPDDVLEGATALSTPRSCISAVWATTRVVQPIAVRGVLAYLIGVLGDSDAERPRIRFRPIRVGRCDILTDRQVVHTSVTAEALFREVCALGGGLGWLVGIGLQPCATCSRSA